MNRLLPSLCLVMLGSPLLAQSMDSNAVLQERYSLITLRKYCAGIESFSHAQRPRMFAQTASGLGPSSGWVEFSSKDAWRRAGQPQPLAQVWYQDGGVARVAISAQDRQSYVEYCYRPDGSLARLRSVPETQIECDHSLFHCSLTVRAERFYHAQPNLAAGEPITGEISVAAQPIDVQSVYGFDVRTLKSERTSYRVASSDWPEYLSVWDLPFGSLVALSTR